MVEFEGMSSEALFMADDLEKKSIKEDEPSGPLMGPKLVIEDVPLPDEDAFPPSPEEGSGWRAHPPPPPSADHSSPYTAGEGHMQTGPPDGRGSYRDVLDNIMRRSMERKGSRLPRVVSSSRETPAKKEGLQKKEEKCGLCLETFERDSKIINCKCGRKYHLLCASHVGQCPICDNDLKTLCDEVMDGRKVRDYSFIWGK